jgi:PEP-CTERM motif
MKRFLLLILVTTACGLYASADVVTNGDFNAGLSGWTLLSQSINGNGTATVDIDGAGPLGSSTAFFTQTEGGFGTQPTILSQIVSLTGGTTYDFEGDFAGIGAQGNASFGQVTVTVAGQQIAFVDFGTDFGSNGGAFYQHLSGTYTPGSDGAVALDLKFFRPYTSSDTTPTNYADNISLTGGDAQPTSTPEPATLTLLGTGILGLVRRRVRRS